MTKTCLKVIRDKMHTDPGEHEDYLSRGGQPYDVMDVPKPAYALLLVGKLHEEAEEIRGDLRNPEEYGDLLQVLIDLGEMHGVPLWKMHEARVEKLIAKGGFTQGRIMIRDPNVTPPVAHEVFPPCSGKVTLDGWGKPLPYYFPDEVLGQPVRKFEDTLRASTVIRDYFHLGAQSPKAHAVVGHLDHPKVVE